MTNTKDQDQKEPHRKQLHLSPNTSDPKKKVDTTVRQRFSHGRSKSVVIERKRGRSAESDRGQGDRRTFPQPYDRSSSKRGLNRLTKKEQETRQRAVADATLEQKRNQQISEEEQEVTEDTAVTEEAEDTLTESDPHSPSPSDVSAPISQEEILRQQEINELQRIKKEEQAKVEQIQKQAEEQKYLQEETQKKKETFKQQRGQTTNKISLADGLGTSTDKEGDYPRHGRKSSGKGGALRKSAMSSRKGMTRRRTSGNKFILKQALNDEDEERTRSLSSVRRAREKKRQHAVQETPKVIQEVVLPEVITVQELANRMAERGADVIKCLMKMGLLVSITQTIDADSAELVITEFGHRVRRVSEADVEIGLHGHQDQETDLQPRPPVVTVMGHVDHGKTSLLDALRETDVAKHETGGITQHIGAYQVRLQAGHKITFIDTPGHAAFTEMRARGTNVTDIVVLVIAADDGIMPQTVEAIHHAKAANVPILIALNKMDLPQANPERIAQELLQHGVVIEDLGGDVLNIAISAKERQGLDKLEEAILLQAEILNLKSNPNRCATGVLIEAKIDHGRGIVASVLVQHGTLKLGDCFVTGCEWGKVRALVDHHGHAIPNAGPSMPFEVLGCNGMPMAGDDFIVVTNEAQARSISEFRQRKRRDLRDKAKTRDTVQQMFDLIQKDKVKELSLILKADVHGSLEAIISDIEKISAKSTEVKVRFLHSGVGAINETDISLAYASKAMIIGFNVRATPQAQDRAKRDDIEMRYYSIIYHITDDIQVILKKMHTPVVRERFLGNAQIHEVFRISTVGKVAGCMVTNGIIRRGAGVRLLRDNVVIHQGTLKTLKRFKEEIKEVKGGYECGMAFENYQNIQIGDIIEAFEIEEVPQL